MQKTLVILTLLILTATPAFARNEKSENKSNNSQKEFGQSHSPKNNEEPNTANNEVLPEITPAESTVTPIPTIQCDPGQEWKNHGSYVSCVAKSGVGGQKVSEAARSNIGKKKATTPSITPSISPTITPTITPSVSPTITPSVSPTITPDPEATPSPTITPTGTPEETANSLLLEVISVLENIKKFLETVNPFE